MSIPPVVVPPSIPAVLPLSPLTLSLTELIQDKLLENFNQSSSNPKEPELKVNKLNPDIPEPSGATDDPEIKELLTPPLSCLSLHPVRSHKIKTPPVCGVYLSRGESCAFCGASSLFSWSGRFCAEQAQKPHYLYSSSQGTLSRPLLKAHSAAQRLSCQLSRSQEAPYGKFS